MLKRNHNFSKALESPGRQSIIIGKYKSWGVASDMCMGYYLNMWGPGCIIKLIYMGFFQPGPCCIFYLSKIPLLGCLPIGRNRIS